MLHRLYIGEDVLRATIGNVESALRTQLEKKGAYGFIGPHEILGILTEE